MINMYCGGQLEYKQGIVHELLKQNIIDFCLTDYIPDKGGNGPEPDDRIVTVNHGPSVSNKYDKVCNLDEIPYPSKEVMEAMLPYESMAIKMGMRFSNYPIADYEEEKRNYLNHLRFWNYMFDKYNINFVYLSDAPHAQGKYVVYGLAKIKKIPMLIIYPCNIKERIFHGPDLFRVGEDVGIKFEELCRTKEKFELTGTVKEFYELYSKPREETKKVVNPKARKNAIKESIKLRYYKYEGMDLYTTYPKLWMKNFISSIKRGFNLDYLDKQGTMLRYTKKTIEDLKLYKHSFEVGIKAYDRMAVEPDYSQKYIYYALQVTPEATTLPRAGVFSEQYNAIQLLARAAEKNGVLVYVKEHYFQKSRHKTFYDDIKKIKNVRLIKTSVNALYVMVHCICSATQTGSCILEGVMGGKPVIVLSEGHGYKKFPGLFEITGEEQGAEVIKTIMNGVTIDKEDVYRYFYALQCETIKNANRDVHNAYVRTGGADGVYVDQVVYDDKLNLLKRYVERYFGGK